MISDDATAYALTAFPVNNVWGMNYILHHCFSYKKADNEALCRVP